MGDHVKHSRQISLDESENLTLSTSTSAYFQKTAIPKPGKIFTESYFASFTYGNSQHNKMCELKSNCFHFG